MAAALLESSLHSLPLLARGKVRDNYAVGDDRLLMVASDRLSAFDVVMGEPIPGKGELLTRMALFWFARLAHVVPNHLTGEDPESVVAAGERAQVRGRSMLVKRLKPLPIEAVVRGYLAGSGWKEYQETQSVCGVALPAGLKNASQLPEPIFTPATKAEAGDARREHFLRTSGGQVIGADLASRVRDHLDSPLQRSRGLRADPRHRHRRHQVRVRPRCRRHADADGRGADAGLVALLAAGNLAGFREGDNPPSYDKQFVRDWLEAVRINGQPWNKRAPAPALPNEVIEKTAAKYREALTRLGA